MEANYISFDSKRSFGVEIEVNRHIPQYKLSSIVSDVLSSGSCDATAWGYTCNNNYWVVKPDSSCGDTGRREDGGGYEVVSKVGRGVKHLLEISNVTQALKDNKAQTNKHCGFHCHVDIGDFSDQNASILLANWCLIENIICNMVPEHRVKSHHCKSFTKDSKKWAAAKKSTTASHFWSRMKLKNLGASSKRNTITLVNYQRSRTNNISWDWFNRPTVELRLPESSLEFSDVKNWSRFFVHFVESCASRQFPKNLKYVELDDFFEIIGLGINLEQAYVLSPGLFECKCWILHRLVKYSTSSKIKNAAMRIWREISSPYMNWKFDFPQVSLPYDPMNALGYDYDYRIKQESKVAELASKPKKSKVGISSKKSYSIISKHSASVW